MKSKEELIQEIKDTASEYGITNERFDLLSPVGMLAHMLVNLGEDAKVESEYIKREMDPNKAITPESLFGHAASRGVELDFSNPASTEVLMGFNLRYLIKYPGAKVPKKLQWKYTVNPNTIVRIKGVFDYKSPYPIIITVNMSTSPENQLMMDKLFQQPGIIERSVDGVSSDNILLNIISSNDTNISGYATIDKGESAGDLYDASWYDPDLPEKLRTNSVNVPTDIISKDGEKYLYYRVKLFQYTVKKAEFRFNDRNFNIFKLPLDDYYVDMDLKYSKFEDKLSTKIQLDKAMINKVYASSKGVLYYQLASTSNIEEITLTHKGFKSDFVTEVGSKLYVKVYQTKGEEANFKSNTAKSSVVLPNDKDLSIDVQLVSDGVDGVTFSANIENIREIINIADRTRNTYITESDLQGALDKIDGGKRNHPIKKYRDSIKRAFNIFSIIKFDHLGQEYNVPTNTLNVPLYINEDTSSRVVDVNDLGAHLSVMYNDINVSDVLIKTDESNDYTPIVNLNKCNVDVSSVYKTTLDKSYLTESNTISVCGYDFTLSHSDDSNLDNTISINVNLIDGTMEFNDTNNQKINSAVDVTLDISFYIPDNVEGEVLTSFTRPTNQTLKNPVNISEDLMVYSVASTTSDTQTSMKRLKDVNRVNTMLNKSYVYSFPFKIIYDNYNGNNQLRLYDNVRYDRVLGLNYIYNNMNSSMGGFIVDNFSISKKRGSYLEVVCDLLLNGASTGEALVNDYGVNLNKVKLRLYLGEDDLVSSYVDGEIVDYDVDKGSYTFKFIIRASGDKEYDIYNMNRLFLSSNKSITGKRISLLNNYSVIEGSDAFSNPMFTLISEGITDITKADSATFIADIINPDLWIDNDNLKKYSILKVGDAEYTKHFLVLRDYTKKEFYNRDRRIINIPFIGYKCIDMKHTSGISYTAGDSVYMVENDKDIVFYDCAVSHNSSLADFYDLVKAGYWTRSTVKAENKRDTLVETTLSTTGAISMIDLVKSTDTINKGRVIEYTVTKILQDNTKETVSRDFFYTVDSNRYFTPITGVSVYNEMHYRHKDVDLDTYNPNDVLQSDESSLQQNDVVLYTPRITKINKLSDDLTNIDDITLFGKYGGAGSEPSYRVKLYEPYRTDDNRFGHINKYDTGGSTLPYDYSHLNFDKEPGSVYLDLAKGYVSDTSFYKIGSYVYTSDNNEIKLYRVLQEVIGSSSVEETTPLNNVYWESLDMSNTANSPTKGDWNNTTEYTIGDIVAYSGGWYKLIRLVPFALVTDDSSLPSYIIHESDKYFEKLNLDITTYLKPSKLYRYNWVKVEHGYLKTDEDVYEKGDLVYTTKDNGKIDRIYRALSQVTAKIDVTDKSFEQIIKNQNDLYYQGLSFDRDYKIGDYVRLDGTSGDELWKCISLKEYEFYPVDSEVMSMNFKRLPSADVLAIQDPTNLNKEIVCSKTFIFLYNAGSRTSSDTYTKGDYVIKAEDNISLLMHGFTDNSSNELKTIDVVNSNKLNMYIMIYYDDPDEPRLENEILYAKVSSGASSSILRTGSESDSVLTNIIKAKNVGLLTDVTDVYGVQHSVDRIIGDNMKITLRLVPVIDQIFYDTNPGLVYDRLKQEMLTVGQFSDVVEGLQSLRLMFANTFGPAKDARIGSISPEPLLSTDISMTILVDFYSNSTVRTEDIRKYVYERLLNVDFSNTSIHMNSVLSELSREYPDQIKTLEIESLANSTKSDRYLYVDNTVEENNAITIPEVINVGVYFDGNTYTPNIEVRRIYTNI